MTQKITLAHGNGGKLMRELIRDVFATEFDNPAIREMSDAATFPVHSQHLKITTDGYTVDPIFFPGGDIGKLAMCGTINDLVVSGAIPEYFTVNFFIEEGFELDKLRRIAISMKNVAQKNNIAIIAGDTKVLPKGGVNGIYLATTGVGRIAATHLSFNNIKPGDKLYASGPLGDHGATVLLARNEFGLTGKLESCCASVLTTGRQLMGQQDVKFMRDPTRGGVATVCHELIEKTGLGITLYQDQLPIRESVKSFCDILGLEPLYLASEGRIIFIADACWSADFINGELHEIGIVEATHSNLLLRTSIGGQRIIPELESNPLPRIC